jgi:hypothetical protein
VSPLFKKLNLKDHKEILVLQSPASFEAELAALADVTVQRDIGAVTAVTFALSFVTRQEDVDKLTQAIAAKAEGDAIIWFAYPKTSSKKYQCEFNRDAGWAALGAAGYEGVRQVAIDVDWSALRFRRVEFIRKFTRSAGMAMSQAGKERVETGGDT